MIMKLIWAIVIIGGSLVWWEGFTNRGPRNPDWTHKRVDTN